MLKDAPSTSNVNKDVKNILPMMSSVILALLLVYIRSITHISIHTMTHCILTKELLSILFFFDSVLLIKSYVLRF